MSTEKIDIRCFNMKIFSGLDKNINRRIPQSNEEVWFLRGLTDNDLVGWLAYADYLDEFADGGGKVNSRSGECLLSKKIKMHVASPNPQQKPLQIKALKKT